MPDRPTLLEIPSDTSGAISAFTANLSRLVSHVEKLEVYIELMKAYYDTVFTIFTR